MPKQVNGVTQCECCEEKNAEVKVSITTMEGVLLDTILVCRVCFMESCQLPVTI